MEKLFIRGLVAHLFADWFLQNEWQANNKTNLLHPAAWVHSGLHFACLLAVFPVGVALIVAVTHLLIDTRKPLIWWRTLIGQTQYDPSEGFLKNSAALHVAFWQDQVAHILVLFAAASVVGGAA